jgi:hypothetical protein
MCMVDVRSSVGLNEWNTDSDCVASDRKGEKQISPWQRI